MDKLTRLVYRSTLRAAKKLDSRPALQALIHRDPRRELPEDFNSVLSVFLRGPQRVFFVPSLLPGPTVAQTIRDAFRFPPGVPNIDSGLMGMRFLSGILQLAEKHGLQAKLPESSTMSPAEHHSKPQVRLQALPEQGCLLASHPLLYASHFNFFYQTVVVLCQHNLSSGSYGLVLNKLMSSNGREVLDDMSRLVDDAAAAGAAGGLNLARDLPAALQALMDHTARNGAEEGVEIDLAGEPPHSSTLSSSSEDDDLDFEVSASDSDADGIDVTFSTSESSPNQPAERADTTFDSTASQLSPTTSYTPASGSAQINQQQQPEQLAVATQTQQQQPQHSASASEALDQQLPSSQSMMQGDAEDQQMPQANAQPHIRSADLTTSQPSSSTQGQDQLIWHGKIKPPPASRDRLESPQSRQTVADAAGDIADPQHPFRFHQVVSSLRRTVKPVNPVQASTQPQPNNPAEQASACWHTAQKSNTPSGFNQTPLGPTADAQPGQEQSSHAGTRFAQSATDRLTADTADQPDFTADNLHNQASDPPVQTGYAGQDVNRRGGTDFQGTGSDAEVLQHSTMSRGGPVPGSQQLHRRADLGGDVVQEPTATCPGLYLGMDMAQAKEAKALGRVSPTDVRFFLGESSWVSQQLEFEINRGSWLLLSPDPQLLHDLVLRPHQFASWSDTDAGNDDKFRTAVRQGMWQHVMTDAASAFADLTNIPKALVKDLQNLKY